MTITLTQRERQILRLYAQGYNYLRIALKLNIAKGTVAVIKKRLADRVGINDLDQLLKYAVGNDLLSDPPPPPLWTEEAREFVRLCALGYEYKEIGYMLNRSSSALTTARQKLEQRLGVTGKVGLIKYAVENGILPCPYNHGAQKAGQR